MKILEGVRISHFQVLARIGKGGMGEVYRARDDSLGREVAIKILPEHLTSDATALSRFEREARLLAAVNHPRIASIYGLERVEGLSFLVLELVHGESLESRLARGPIPVPEALAYGRQIAEALEAAHEKDVIHRDLKPANVMVTPENQVKLLDFGLARTAAVHGTPWSGAEASTITAPLTDGRLIMGTPAYMSPEQTRGAPVDKRTDIWSFGCTLFALLAGRAPFEGGSVSDCIAKILERDPDWAALPPGLPRPIETLLRRCLRKEAARRLRDIGDARIIIEDVLSRADDVREPSPLSRRWWTGRRTMSTLALFALVVATLWSVNAWRTRRMAVTATGLPPPIMQLARLTNGQGLNEGPSWSSDGSLIVFASNRSGNFEIYVRRVDSGQEIDITNDPGEDVQPSLSPDGNSIAFISTRASEAGLETISNGAGVGFRTYGGDLWIAPTLGGSARRLATGANYPCWFPDGSRVAFVAGADSHRSILEIPIDGGPSRELLRGADSHWEIVRIARVPRSTALTFESEDGEIWWLPGDGAAPHLLTTGLGHAWDWRGGLLYSSERDPSGGTRLRVARVDIAAGRIESSPRNLNLMTASMGDLAIAPDGKRFVATELETSLNLARIALPAGGTPTVGPEELLNPGRVNDHMPAVSPDGRRIAFSSDRLGPTMVWVLELASRQLRQIQLRGKDSSAIHPFWSRDGRRIGLTREFVAQGSSVWVAALDGSESTEIISPAAGLHGEDFSPDGSLILFSSNVGSDNQIFLFDAKTGARRQITSGPGAKFGGRFSPDGRYIGFAWSRSGPYQIYLVPVAGGEPFAVTSGPERAVHFSFSPDSETLFFQLAHRNVFRMSIHGGAPRRVTAFPESGLLVEDPVISPDGRWLAYCKSNRTSSLWLMTLGSADLAGQ